MIGSDDTRPSNWGTGSLLGQSRDVVTFTQFMKLANELVVGGKGDHKKDSSFSSASLAEGIKTELEHTHNKAVAKEIAKDHLSEDPQYYKKLKLIEGKGVKFQYSAPSSSDPNKSYKLSINNGNISCTCPGFRYKRRCYHADQLRAGLNSGDLESHHLKKVAEAFYDELSKLAARDYKDEYAKFQSSRKSKVDRAHRNKIRRRLLASGRVKKHDGRDVDHRDGNPRNNGSGNIAVTSKSYNRGKH